MNRVLYYSFACTLMCIYLCAGCKDKNCPEYLRYKIPLTLSPAQDTFQLGDTIWVELDFDHTLTDVNGGVTNTFSNYNFRFEWQCEKINMTPLEGHTVDYLFFVGILGTTEPVGLPSSGVSFYKVFPEYDGQVYRFKCGFVLQDTGTFFVALNSYKPVAGYDRQDGWDCSRISFVLDTKINNGDPDENNYYLLKTSPEPVYQKMTKERFGTGGFVFVVVE